MIDKDFCQKYGHKIKVISTDYDSVFLERRNVLVEECTADMVVHPQGTAFPPPLSDDEGELSPDPEPPPIASAPDTEEAPLLRRSERIPVPSRRMLESLQAASTIELQSLPATPSSIQEALSGLNAADWREAIKHECEQVTLRRVLKPLADLPAGRTAMPAKLVLRVSRLPQTGLLKYKARLCPKGCFQVYGVDYEKTFAPTVCYRTVCVCLHLMATLDWEAVHVDIGNAYAEAPPDRALYVRLPKVLVEMGFSSSMYNELLQNFYGTKQAGEVWYSYLCSKLGLFGFKKLAFDACAFGIFENGGGNRMLIMLVYVDDLLILGNWQQKIDQLRSYLANCFRVVKWQVLERFLGIDIERDRANRTVYLHQHDYVDDLLEDIPRIGKPLDAPASPYVDLRAIEQGNENPLFADVGKLRFLADRTRPDILIATGILCSCAAHPAPEHVRALTRVHKYLKGTRSTALKLGGPIDPTVFVDAACCPSGDSKSTFGYALYLSRDAGAAVCKAKRSDNVHKSSLQAEVCGAVEAATCAKWLADMMEELRMPLTSPIPLLTDSLSAVQYVHNGGNYEKAKHFTRQINFLREYEANKIVAMEHIAGEYNVADLLTKPLGNERFVELREKLFGGYC